DRPAVGALERAARLEPEAFVVPVVASGIRVLGPVHVLGVVVADRQVRVVAVVVAAVVTASAARRAAITAAVVAGRVHQPAVLLVLVLEAEGVDAPVAEVADEEIAAEAPELRRCERQAPRRVEPPAARDPAEERAGGVVGVDEAEPTAV